MTEKSEKHTDKHIQIIPGFMIGDWDCDENIIPPHSQTPPIVFFEIQSQGLLGIKLQVKKWQKKKKVELCDNTAHIILQ